MRLRERARHRGLHGHAHVDRQRRHALLMCRTALARVGLWAVMMVAGVLPAVRHSYEAVFFVTELSLLALLLTDWGQYAASSAELAAGDAHHDSEVTRRAVETDFSQIDSDIARLADLQPGPEAKRLASEIRQRLAG